MSVSYEEKNEEALKEEEINEEKESSINDEAKKIMELEEENIQLKDALLRKQADYENYRKRMIKEKEETVKFANSNLLLDIVSIIDDFERAIYSAEESKDFDNFHNGIVLIEKQFTSMLEKKWGLKKIESLKKTFDPEQHEALMVEESGDTDEEIVSVVFQNGYMLNNRIIRNAKVKVLKPGKTEAAESEEN